MKKFIVQLAISPATDSMTLDALRTQLKSLGEVQIDVLEEVNTATSLDPALNTAYWIFVSADEEDPYLLVSGACNSNGVEIPAEALKQLVEQGVCTEFYAEYPRADRYGAPRYASSDAVAEAVVSYHFAVASEGLSVCCEDRGDDGVETIWLKVMSKDLGAFMPNLPAKIENFSVQSTATSDDEEHHRFRNFYCHADCHKQPGIEWDSTWSSMCNDPCPACGAEIEPLRSEDFDEDEQVTASTIKVGAKAHSDDRVIDVAFDCTRWFQQARHDDIMALNACGWQHDYPADSVAEFMADFDEDAKLIFTYLDILGKAKKECGFECEVSKSDAIAWLKENRKGTWATLICEVTEVRLIESQDEANLGRWDWNDDRGNASETSFATQGEVALNAVQELSLESASQG